MKKRFKYDLSNQFRERCINMSAWAEKHNISRSLLTLISSGKIVGRTDGKARKIVKLLQKEGFQVELLRDKAA